MNSKLFLTSTTLLAGLLSVANASATNLFNPVVSSTTTIDGNSVALNGTLNDTNGNSQPWTAELYAAANQCLRLFVTSTAFDAKITVVAPNGSVYRDDDSGGSLRPLVRIASAPVTGWYTVQVAHYAGLPQNANFTLLYGTYTPGNINCAGGTSPLAIGLVPEIIKDRSIVLPAEPKNPVAP